MEPECIFLDASRANHLKALHGPECIRPHSSHTETVASGTHATAKQHQKEDMPSSSKTAAAEYTEKSEEGTQDSAPVHLARRSWTTFLQDKACSFLTENNCSPGTSSFRLGCEAKLIKAWPNLSEGDILTKNWRHLQQAPKLRSGPMFPAE
ncbi:hypothetical protein CYMTET_47104 [Cymbomonas tetramitiformis]|uniref:Uncharacterized protein n=1 Tax=Cymbomonas tetramitiformis TaxID=36881 RepID=A0AAE0BWS9_9CHLO|nr:hypothetical protein CYMTET_47104 [Cymbomonas tetramitiformis]